MNIRLKKAVLILILPIIFVGFKVIYKKNNLAVLAKLGKANSSSIEEMEEESEIFLDKKYSKEQQRKAQLSFKAYSKADLNYYGMKYVTDAVNLDTRNINFGEGDYYSYLKGVTCFRGNNMRDGGSYGNAYVKEEKLEIVWKKSIGSIDNWTGVGWNGQPSIVQWDKDVIATMNIKAEKKEKDNLKEVIYATLDGNVYFLDLEDGKDTRDKLKIGAPVKGSLTVDPRGIPLLYVGQGIDTNGGRYVDFAYRIFSLTNFQKLYEIKGRDNLAGRYWGAFDSTALIDKTTDTFFECGENGLFYSGTLNTKYENGNISINPKINKYRYDIPSKDKRGIENSIAIYKNYGYFADNDGMLQCLDLNTLKPVWVLNVNDDTDSTIVLEKGEDVLNLYTACEVDHQGSGGYSYVRKIDATSGKILWENKYICGYNEEVNGGALATPIVGKGDISNLVIFNIARHPGGSEGLLVAIDKNSGKEVWSMPLKNYCWSSPIALYTDSQKSYLIQCDSTGKAILIEGISGKLLDTIELGGNVEGSPAAFNNNIVVGTRRSEIIGFRIK